MTDISTYQIQITINDPIGFHTRTASIFAKKASTFSAEITVTYNDKKVNAKSMLSLMALGARSSAEISIQSKGFDAQMAALSLSQLVANGFKEKT